MKPHEMKPRVRECYDIITREFNLTESIFFVFVNIEYEYADSPMGYFSLN